MDPLDGSPTSTLTSPLYDFSIYRRVTPVGTPVTEEDFGNRATRQVAAGYVVYGSSTMLVYTTGCGVHAFTYDPPLASSACARSACASRKRATPTPLTKVTSSSSRRCEEVHQAFARKKIRDPAPVHLALHRLPWWRFPPQPAKRRDLLLPGHRQPPGG